MSYRPHVFSRCALTSMPRPVIVLHQAFWSIGAVFEVLLALWIMPLLGWRWLLGLSTIPVVIFLICCYVSVFFFFFFAFGCIRSILLFSAKGFYLNPFFF